MGLANVWEKALVYLAAGVPEGAARRAAAQFAHHVVGADTRWQLDAPAHARQRVVHVLLQRHHEAAAVAAAAWQRLRRESRVVRRLQC